MFKRYFITLGFMLVFMSYTHATTEFVIHNFHIQMSSDQKQINQNVANGLKNYFSRYENIGKENLSSIINDSKKNIRKSMEVYGFFSPEIKFSYKTINQQVYISYNIKTGQKVIIGGLDVSIPDEVIKKAKLSIIKIQKK